MTRNSPRSGERGYEEECPSREQILAFLDDTIAEPTAEHVTRHLDQCPTCQAVADALTSKERWQNELTWFSPNDSPQGAKSPLTFEERFTILEPVGVGGFATVFRARDNVLNRIVALKLPHLPLSALPETGRRRFVTELQASAALHHPNIVPVFDAGVDQHQCFLVSEFIEGQTLAKWLTEQTEPIDFRLAAELLAQLADGVQHAHAAHILHRDLKPSNVLMDTTRASGGMPFTPKVTDFGLARILEADVTSTQDGTILGSASYMSPEQAEGKISQLGPTSDIYALGVILYQLLTQQLPINASITSVVLYAVIHAEPLPPRRLRSNVPPDLEAICLTCLEKAPTRRYATADDLAADLRRFLNGQPVTVRSPTTVERLWRWAKRHPAWSGLIATIAVSIATVATLLARHSGAVSNLNADLANSNKSLTTALTQSQAATRRAEDEERRALETVYAYDIRRAFEAWQSWDALEVRATAARYANDLKRSDLRGVEWHWLNRQFQRESREVTRLPQAVYRMALAPDRRSLAVAGRDDLVRLVELPTGRTLAEWAAHQGEVNGMAFSPDGKTLWTGGDDGTVAAWEATQKTETLRFNAHPGHWVFEVLFDAQRERLVTCANEPTIRLWDARTCEPRGELAGHSANVEVVVLHPDGQRLFSGSADATIREWHLDTQVSQLVGEKLTGGVRCLAISPNGRWLAVGSNPSQLLLWDLARDRVRVDWRMKDRIDRVAFGSTSERLFAVDAKGVAFEWPLPSTNKAQRPLPPFRVWSNPGGRPYDLLLTPDDPEFLIASHDGSLRAHSVVASENDDLELPLARVLDFACLADNRVAVAEDHRLLLVDLQNIGEQPRVLHEPSNWRQIEVSPDGSHLAAKCTDGETGVWRLSDGQRLLTRDASYAHMSFTPNNQSLALADTKAGRAEVLNLHTGWQRDFLAYDCQQVTFSPTGNWFAFESAREGPNPTRDLQVLDWPSCTARFSVAIPSRDRLMIAGSANGRALRLFDVVTGRITHEWIGHQAAITCATFSPDSRTLATSGADARIKLWHVATGQFLLEFPTEQASTTTRCHFSPDGRWLAYFLKRNVIRFVRLK